MTNQTPFCKRVLGEEFGNTATARGVKPDVPGKLFNLHNKHAVQVGTSTLSKSCATYETEEVKSMLPLSTSLWSSQCNHGASPVPKIRSLRFSILRCQSILDGTSRFGT